MCLASSIPLFQVAQLYPQDSSLQFIQAGIDSHHLMQVAHARTMVTQHLYLLCQCVIVGNTDTGFTVGPQVFAVVEAKATDITQTPYSLSLVGGSMGLRRILDHA